MRAADRRLEAYIGVPRWAVGGKLLFLLDRIKDDTIVYIGSKSAFFYIGTKKDFVDNIDSISSSLLDLFKRAPKDFVPLKDRRIKDVYRRLGDDGIVIVLEGKEPGMYWTIEEYREAAGAD